MNNDLNDLTNFIRQLPGVPTASVISFRTNTDPETWDFLNDDSDLEEMVDRLGKPAAYLFAETCEADIKRLRIFRLMPPTATAAFEARQCSWLAVATWLPRLQMNRLVAEGIEPAGPSPSYARLLLPPPFL